MSWCPLWCFPWPRSSSSASSESKYSSCSICNGCLRNPVLSNCFHQFCCKCFLDSWHPVETPVNCPLCQSPIYRVLRCFGSVNYGTGNRLELRQLDPDDERPRLISFVDEYNSYFAFLNPALPVSTSTNSISHAPAGKLINKKD